VLKLTLGEGTYQWVFLPVAGQTFTDSGSDTCTAGTRASSTVAAADAFTRTVTGGLGTADTGGTWLPRAGAASFSVDGQRGRVVVPAPGNSRAASLPSVSVRDVDVVGSFATDRLVPSGFGYTSSLVARRVADNTEYRARLRFDASSVYLAITRATGTSAETLLAPEVRVTGLTPPGAGSAVRVRFHVDGTAPTTLRARAWIAGASEPTTWNTSATDGTAALQNPGSVGVQHYASGSAPTGAVTFFVDDFEASAPGPPPPPPPPNPVVASDTYTRTQATGWGTTDPGGTWSVSAPADFSVDGTRGAIRLGSAGVGRSAVLPAVSRTDADVHAAFAMNKAPTGSGQYATLILRRVSSGNEYAVRVRMISATSATVSLTRRVGGVETLVSPEAAIAGFGPTATVRVRARVTGTGPTALSARAWVATGTEPATWQVSANDASAALQAAGVPGVSAYLSSSATSAPVVLSVDDFEVRAP
jgi:hypothetical protein